MSRISKALQLHLRARYGKVYEVCEKDTGLVRYATFDYPTRLHKVQMALRREGLILLGRVDVKAGLVVSLDSVH